MRWIIERTTTFSKNYSLTCSEIILKQIIKLRDASNQSEKRTAYRRRTF